MVLVVKVETQNFFAHLNYLRRRSTYFASLCSTPEFDQQPQEHRLANFSMNTFKLWLRSIYYSPTDLATLAFETGSDSGAIRALGTGGMQRLKTCTMLVDLSILAERLGDQKSKNRVIDNLIRENYWQLLSTTWAWVIFDFVYYKTKPGSPLRRWLVSSIAPTFKENNFEELTSKMPKEMHDDVFKLFVAHRNGIGQANRPKESDAANFYE